MSEENEKLPPDLEQLLDAERSYPEESVERRARVKSAVVKAIAIGAPLAVGVHVASNVASSAATTTATTVAATKAGFGFGAVVSIAAATFVVGGLTGVFVDRQISPPSDRAQQVAQTSQPSHHDAPAEGQGVANDVVDAEVAPIPTTPQSDNGVIPNEPTAPVQRTQRTTPPSAQNLTGQEGTSDTLPPHESTLPREREIVDVARAALVRNRPADALSALERHRAQFPAGQLAEERDALIVQALERSGRADDAAVAASRFHAQYPRSLFTSAVDAALARARAMQER